MQLELIRFEHGDLKLEVNVSPSEETVWLSLDDMAMLFGRDRSVIGKHVKNALFEECEKNSVWAKFARTGSDGKTYYVDYYNLDVVISVGYRVKSRNGIIFRKWGANVLKEYLLRGYVVDENKWGPPKTTPHRMLQNQIRPLRRSFLVPRTPTSSCERCVLPTELMSLDG